MDCITSFSGTGPETGPRRQIIAKTVSVLEALPTPMLIELLCEIARLCPEDRWQAQAAPVPVPAGTRLRLHQRANQADCESSRDASHR